MPGFLENYIANLLDSYIGQYCKDLNRKQLNVSIFKGDMVLENLELKSTALENLNLPVVVHRGVIGKLKLTIPWSKLQSKPVVCDVCDVVLLLKPCKAEPWDEADEQRLRNEWKQRKLLEFEKERERRAQMQEGPGHEKKKDGLLSKVQSAIINNFQIKIHNVHVRYEDAVTNLEKPFAVGLMFKHLSCVSTDELWNVNFVQSADICKIMHNLAQLRRFSLYVDPGVQPPMMSTAPLAAANFCSAMTAMIAETNKAGFHVLQPIDAFQKMKVQRGQPDLRLPQIALDTLFDQVQLQLDRPQYECFLRCASYAKGYARTNQFRKFIPRCRPTENPRAWWQCAFECVRLMIREKRHRTRITWEGIRRWKANSGHYIQLHKMRQSVEWMPPFAASHEKEYADLERLLPLPDLLMLRRMAYAQLLSEELAYRRQQQQLLQVPEARVRKRKTFFFAQKKTPSEDQRGLLDLIDPTVGLSEVERSDLQSQLGLDGDEDEGRARPLPADYVNRAVSTTLSGGVLALYMSGGRQPSTEVVFSDFGFVFSKRAGGSFRADTTLQSFVVHTHSDTQFPCLVRRADCLAEGFGWDPVGLKDLPLLRLEFETQMPGGAGGTADADFSVGMHLQPLDITADPCWLSECRAFFAAPYRMVLGGARLDLGRTTAQQRVRAVLDGGQTVTLNCHLQAPTFTIPKDPREPDSDVLFVDLGTLFLHSDLDYIRQRRERRQAGDYVEADAYEKYSVHMGKLNARVTTTAEVQSRTFMGQQLVENFGVRTEVLRALDPGDDPGGSVPLLKLTADIEQLQVHMSRGQLLAINKVLHSFSQLLYSEGGGEGGGTAGGPVRSRAPPPAPCQWWRRRVRAHRCMHGGMLLCVGAP